MSVTNDNTKVEILPGLHHLYFFSFRFLSGSVPIGEVSVCGCAGLEETFADWVLDCIAWQGIGTDASPTGTDVLMIV